MSVQHHVLVVTEDRPEGFIGPLELTVDFWQLHIECPGPEH